MIRKAARTPTPTTRQARPGNWKQIAPLPEGGGHISLTIRVEGEKLFRKHPSHAGVTHFSSTGNRAISVRPNNTAGEWVTEGENQLDLAPEDRKINDVSS